MNISEELKDEIVGHLQKLTLLLDVQMMYSSSTNPSYYEHIENEQADIEELITRIEYGEC